MTAASRTYALRHTVASRIAQSLPLLQFAVLCSIVWVTRPIAHAALSALLALLALAVPFAAWRFYARFPTRIDWTGAARLRLSALGLSVELDARDVESISPDPQFLGFFTLRYRGGKKLRLLAQFDDFHELLTRLRAANPNIELRGC